MKRDLYAPPFESVEVEGGKFKLTTTGGPLLSFLTILLLPALVECDAMEFSIFTYNNKRYGALMHLDMNGLRDAPASESRVDEYLKRLKRRTFYTPVWYIPRFLDTFANILEPSHTKCHFGKEFAVY